MSRAIPCHYSGISEGDLSKLRAILVNSKNLAEKSKKLNLGSCLVFSKSENEIDFSKQESILADLFEAVTASLLLDAGYSKTEQWLKSIFHDDIFLMAQKLIHTDAKGALQHWTQKVMGVIPIYSTSEISKSKSEPMFEATLTIGDRKFSAFAKTKKDASKKAAEQAMELIEKGVL